LKQKIKDGKEYIFDPIRKKYIFLTPEEWVRQQLLQYFIIDLNYPASLISVEKQIRVGSQLKRYDILVYQSSTPWMIVECKQEEIKITKENLVQLEAYTSSLHVQYLAISNGKEIHCYDIKNSCWMNEFPQYPMER
jgi:hypothetical protein